MSNIWSASKQYLEIYNTHKNPSLLHSHPQTLLKLWNQAVHELLLPQSLILNY